MDQRSAKAPRKQQQRSLRTRQKLLDAALEAFSENGFKGTSTRDIASRAGVHHPLITYHFNNKDRLWRSAVRHGITDFINALKDAQQRFAGRNAKDRFAAMIRIYVRYAAKNPTLHKIVLQESGQTSERLNWLSEHFLAPLADTAAGIIGELQAKGVTPPGNPYLIYNMIRVSSGTLIALALELKNTSNLELETEASLDELASTIIRIFMPGGAEPA